ncbi:MAG: hypothetical protein RLN76_09865 [Phycisphaeraceae bacterium]
MKRFTLQLVCCLSLSISGCRYLCMSGFMGAGNGIVVHQPERLEADNLPGIVIRQIPDDPQVTVIGGWREGYAGGRVDAPSYCHRFPLNYFVIYTRSDESGHRAYLMITRKKPDDADMWLPRHYTLTRPDLNLSWHAVARRYVVEKRTQPISVYTFQGFEEQNNRPDAQP